MGYKSIIIGLVWTGGFAIFATFNIMHGELLYIHAPALLFQLTAFCWFVYIGKKQQRRNKNT